MTEPHKRPHRHPTYKTAYRVKNWHEYDQSLRDRGDITLWISQDAIDAWAPPMTGKRGAQPVYADLAIETALTFRLLFHLPLRQTEGFLSAVLQLMGLTLPCPDHTTRSRRNATVDIGPLKKGVQQEPTCLIVDSSGLKVCGQGAWHTQKHGEKQHKRWKKLHIGVDTQGRIVASTVTESPEQDPSQVPELLSQVDRAIDRFRARGWHVRPSARVRCCHGPLPGSQRDHPAPQGCGVERPSGALTHSTRSTSFGHREGGSVCMETNIGLLRSESRGECLFPMQAELRRPIAGEARGVPGTGNLAGLRVAQSDARPGSS